MTMSAQEVIQQIKALPADERAVVFAFFQKPKKSRPATNLAQLPDGHGSATVAELLAEADAEDYALWNPNKDLAGVRMKLRSRLKGSKRKTA
jgi:hypothetical protein